MINFYDTSALLIKVPREHFYISSVTVAELENIKTAYNKDYDIKTQARKLSNWLSENLDKYTMIRYTQEIAEYLPVPEKEASNDMKILTTAIYLKTTRSSEVNFFTNDNNLFLFARELELAVEKIKPEEYDYTGIKEVILTDEEMADYYSHMDSNYFNLFRGQYLVIKNTDDEVVDRGCYDGERIRRLEYDTIGSNEFPGIGIYRPKKDDVEQACLFDSLKHNQVNLITGKPGSGKTELSLAYLLGLLDYKIDHLVIFCNPVVAHGAAKLGYYPGTVEEKLLSTQIGNILSSKIGNKEAVESLIQNGTLILMPIGDSRGFEVPPKSAAFITEAQNFDADLLRLTLQRCGEDTIVIVEGDDKEQTDINIEPGKYSGIAEMSKAFRGASRFGQVQLKNIYRSETARLADRMGRG